MKSAIAILLIFVGLLQAGNCEDVGIEMYRVNFHSGDWLSDNVPMYTQCQVSVNHVPIYNTSVVYDKKGDMSYKSEIHLKGVDASDRVFFQILASRNKPAAGSELPVFGNVSLSVSDLLMYPGFMYYYFGDTPDHAMNGYPRWGQITVKSYLDD